MFEPSTSAAVLQPTYPHQEHRRQKKYGQISRHGVSETAPGDILLIFGIGDLPHYIQSKILLVGGR